MKDIELIIEGQRYKLQQYTQKKQGVYSCDECAIQQVLCKHLGSIYEPCTHLSNGEEAYFVKVEQDE